MSAERTKPKIVRPSSVSEKSAIANAVGLFSDVVASGAASSVSNQESVIAVRIQQFQQSLTGSRDGSIFIIIVYMNGVQVWHMSLSGESHAMELLSLRISPPKIYTLIWGPHGFDLVTCFDEKQSTSVTPFNTVKVVSYTNKELWEKKFNSSVNSIYASTHLLIVTFHGKLAAFDRITYESKFTISDCYVVDGPDVNPVAVGPHWLAYSSNKFVDHIKSSGKTSNDLSPSLASTALSAAKSMAQGLSSISDSIFGGMSSLQLPRSRSSSLSGSASHHNSGVVTLINCGTLTGHFELNETCRADNNVIVAHFPALPVSHSVSYLKFDPSGSLLFAACSSGQNFHVFRILPDPVYCNQTLVQHLYVLHRGDTAAQIVDVSFNVDSRWVSVCTARGTTHIFPINPYGGKPCVRTHTSPLVVNKSTNFMKSVGLDESPPRYSVDNKSTNVGCLSKNTTGSLVNRRLNPATTTELIQPIVQIKRNTGHCTHKHIASCNVAALFPVTNNKYRSRNGDRLVTVLTVTDSGGLIEHVVTADEGASNEADPSGTESHNLLVYVKERRHWPLIRCHQDNTTPNSFPFDSAVLSQFDFNSSDQSDDIEVLTSNNSGDFDQPFFSQVEIVTYNGPSRRLWMGPQFKFKTYQTDSITISNQSAATLTEKSSEVSAMSDIICESTDLNSLPVLQGSHPSKPINMPKKTMTTKRHQHSGEAMRIRHGSSLDEIYIAAGSLDPAPHLQSEPVPCELFEDAKQTFWSDEDDDDSRYTSLIADAVQDLDFKSQSSATGGRSDDIPDLMSFPPS